MRERSKGESRQSIGLTETFKGATRDAIWPAEEYRFGAFVLRTDRRELRHEGVLRPMERRCFDLLAYLLRHAGRVVTKDELLDNVWSSRFVSTSVIAQSVLKVRKALYTDASLPELVRTVHRVGYRLAADVERRRIMPSELLSHREAGVWDWQRISASGLSCQEPWAVAALDAFGIWALQSHGVAVRDDMRIPGPNTAITTHCEVRSLGDGDFGATLEMIDKGGHRHQLDGLAGSPFEAVWRAAGAAALLAQLNAMLLVPCSAAKPRCWEQLALLPQPTVPGQAHTIAPLSSAWSTLLPKVSGDVLADLLMEAAWRDDAGVAAELHRLSTLATPANGLRYAIWLDLCEAMVATQAGGRPEEIALTQAHADALLEADTETAHRQLATAAHLLCASRAAPVDAPWWRRWVSRHPMSLPPASRRWWLLSALQLRLAHPEEPGAEPGTEVIQQLLLQPIEDGLQSLLLNLYGQLCEMEGDLETATRHLQHAADMAIRAPWRTSRPLCLLTLGTFAARLHDVGTLDTCIRALSTVDKVHRPRRQAILAWLQARRMRIDGSAADALRLADGALADLSTCGLWMREDFWLFLIDTALHARARGALERIRATLDGAAGRARSATLSAIDASLALLDGDKTRARQLIVRAWQLAPPSTSKRLLAMAAATALQWGMPDTTHEWNQAMGQAGDWIERTRNGRRLRQPITQSAGPTQLPGDALVVAEEEPSTFWLWSV
ncbi:MAG: transcriptional regulator [Hydrogenophaga sp.]|uniref:winged helix-turn-helix domain-containing protein n=1 Tax=Hydrogenophaga sp. TaxID=1904254 RepID=UPI001D47453F|nr:transcriptional regulator [Hydrogenophaga sp.]MBX3611399.1 transcriptional regulator [Hydrogenophaga sp.]